MKDGESRRRGLKLGEGAYLSKLGRWKLVKRRAGDDGGDGAVRFKGR